MRRTGTEMSTPGCGELSCCPAVSLIKQGNVAGSQMRTLIRPFWWTNQGRFSPRATSEASSHASLCWVQGRGQTGT